MFNQSMFNQFEELIAKLLTLGFEITFRSNEKLYFMEVQYKNIRARVACPKGQFKEGAYKVLKEMSNQVFVKGETK